MDGRNFDDLTRRLARGQSRRSILRGMIGGGAALLSTTAGAGLAAQKKVTICHHPPGNPTNVQVISVGQSAVAAHLAHGDTVLGTVESCTGCGDVCVAPDACTAARCDTDGCNTETACGPADACTAPRCDDGVCNTATACSPADACTAARCDGGVCNTASDCEGLETCGGGGTAGQCGCTTDTEGSCAGLCGNQTDNCGRPIFCGDCCSPACSGKNCGDDGCGSTCGECDEGEVCNANGICQDCAVCGGYESCGTDSQWGLCATVCDTEDVVLCLANRLCDQDQQCDTSAACPPGEHCLAGNCCGFPVCIPVCDHGGEGFRGTSIETDGDGGVTPLGG